MMIASIVFSAVVLAQTADTITGEVVDGQARPVANAEVVFSAGFAIDGSVPILERATTDESGRFRLARPGAARLQGFLVPGVIWAYKPGLALAVADLVRGDWPGQIHRLVLEPPLVRKVTLRDAGGKPVAGARLAPRLVRTELTSYQGVAIPDEWLDRLTVPTDAGGVAAVPGSSRLTDLCSLRLTIPGQGMHALQIPYAQRNDDATLVLGRPASLAGAIRNATGSPVDAVVIDVWTRCAIPISFGQSSYRVPERIRFDAGPIRTGAGGSFQTTAVLRAGSTYRVVVRAAGFAPAVSDWITLTGTSDHLPPVTLRPLRTLVGCVVDRLGKPIAGVQISQPAGGPATMTDEAGRFRLEQASPGRSFLLARRDGFRFQGWLIDVREPAPIELTLSRLGEPPVQMKATLPEPIPLAESRALARRVLDPFLNEAVARGDDSAKLWTLSVLRWLDPSDLLAKLQTTSFQLGSKADYVKGQAALAFAAADPDEAAAIVETISDPAGRADTQVDLVDALPASERQRKLDWLDRAAFQARAAMLSSNKLYVMGEVAERWLELGQPEKARTLFAEGKKLVESLPVLKRTDAGGFLARLARVEPLGVLALLENVGTNSWRQRTYANVAIRLAYEHPAEAEQVLDRLGEPLWRFTAAARICRRLAQLDSPRARRIATALPDPTERAYAWAFLADGLVPTDHDGALVALNQALREIESIDPRDAYRMIDANPAVSILPLVERIAPERVAEVFWRAVALHPVAGDPRTDFGQDNPWIPEALLLSRYDREAAATLLEPVTAYAGSLSLRGGNDITPAVLLARAAIDPRGAVALVESLPPARTPGINEPANWARYSLAEHLAMPPERRWMRIWRFNAGCGLAMFDEAYRGL